MLCVADTLEVVRSDAMSPDPLARWLAPTNFSHTSTNLRSSPQTSVPCAALPDGVVIAKLFEGELKRQSAQMARTAARRCDIRHAG